jgi:hypothetical protein
MHVNWKRAILILCMAVLAAGPFVQLHHAAAQGENPGMMLQQARTTNDKARTELNNMMMRMDSMNKMPMSSNEKEMMKMMHNMAQIMMMLIDSNRQLIGVVEHAQMK